MTGMKKTPARGREKPIQKGRTWARRGVLGALLLTAGILVWAGMPARPAREGALSMPSAPASRVTPAPTEARAARETAYDKDVETLRLIAQSEETDADTRQQAAQRLTRMVADHQSELGIEEALSRAGFSPCLVLLQNDALTVMVNAQELTAAQSVTILSLCAAHTEIGTENIRIMTVNGEGGG